MQVRFWGTRGSIPSPGPGTVRYGGNTACVEIRSAAGAVVVFDCGTGARPLGQALVDEAAAAGTSPDGALFIGHTHWDHIQGLPFFAPLFHPGSVWHIHGPRGLGQTLGQTLAGQMQYQYFPVTVEELAAHVTYHDLLEGQVEVGDLRVTAQYLNHTALTLGYRIEGDGVAVVYACDHEPFDPGLAAGGDLLANPQDARHVSFLAGADFVIHDAQYLPAEYEGKRGWGHSTVQYTVDAARLAGVGELALFHHDPQRTDDDVDALLHLARDHADATGYLGSVVAAAEGATYAVQRRTAPLAAAAVPTPSAMYDPAGSDLTASILVTAADPAVRAAIRAAADAEHLPVREMPDLTDEAAATDGVVVLDHDEDRSRIDALRLALRASKAARVAVLALTRGRPSAITDNLVTDWLVLPASIGHIRTKLRAAVLRRACRWQSAPMPDDEDARLKAVHDLGLLDTEPEERFDQHTRAACRALDVPVALVTLVDSDRQWFKSRQGIEVTETPRDQSLCAHVILGDDVMQVPDVLDDDRFADNPLVAKTDARFYAGAPLVLSDGSRVGTFCVVDLRPRVLDDAEVDELRRLADLVQVELERA
jgi:phosphoribosyl 1,2-cyclic phosphodiesterase/GAF domain-containing protein